MLWDPACVQRSFKKPHRRGRSLPISSNQVTAGRTGSGVRLEVGLSVPRRQRSGGVRAKGRCHACSCSVTALPSWKRWRARGRRGARGGWPDTIHRQTLIERILLRRAAWLRAGGELVLQWTPAHCGVYVVAKAFLARAPTAPIPLPRQTGRRLCSTALASSVHGVARSTQQRRGMV